MIFSGIGFQSDFLEPLWYEVLASVYLEGKHELMITSDSLQLGGVIAEARFSISNQQSGVGVGRKCMSLRSAGFLRRAGFPARPDLSITCLGAQKQLQPCLTHQRGPSTEAWLLVNTAFLLKGQDFTIPGKIPETGGGGVGGVGVVVLVLVSVLEVGWDLAHFLWNPSFRQLQ